MVLTWLEVLSMVDAMFERFTPRARRVVVLSQEEARGLGHNYIGTEHILLGLLAVPDGVAGRALDSFGLSLAGVREEVTARVGAGNEPMKGHIPFTPRAKKILELALREALQLHHNYIGTEHLLLGLMREKEGQGPQILAAHADLLAVRTAVLDVLSTAQAPVGRLLRRRPGVIGEPEEELRATPAAEASLDEAASLAGPQPVGSHHLLLAMLSDPSTAAARTLTGLGVDLDKAKDALRGADVTGTSDEQPEERGRRHMTIRATDNSLTIEATDRDIVGLGRAAAEAVGGQADQAGIIRGDLPASASLGAVWQALRASLEDIRRRATVAASGQATAPAAEETAAAGEQSAGEEPAGGGAQAE
jgi:ATP-dependent Clp protease ATP-binding subunit ClpA